MPVCMVCQYKGARKWCRDCEVRKDSEVFCATHWEDKQALLCYMLPHLL
jgi:hypothetical protein